MDYQINTHPGVVVVFFRVSGLSTFNHRRKITTEILGESGFADGFIRLQLLFKRTIPGSEIPF